MNKISTAHGCGDNSCMFGSPGGMATNGGCRCLNDTERDRRIHIRAGISELREQRDQLVAALRVIAQSCDYCRDDALITIRTITGEGV